MPLDCCSEHVGLSPGRKPSERHPARRPVRAGEPHGEGADQDGGALREVAGVDVDKASFMVCVRRPGARRGSRKKQTRTCMTTTGVAAALLEEGLTIAAAR